MDRTQLCGSCDVGSIPTERTSYVIVRKNYMAKDRFIRRNGKTLAPYPLYPNEVRDEKSSAGKFKSSESNEPDFTDMSRSAFTFSLIAKTLKSAQ
jgi:hypothetical protein